MQRREFFQLLAASGYGYLALRLAACAPVGGHTSSTLADAEYDEIRDLIMQGWSTLGSGFLGAAGPLLAQKIIDGITSGKNVTVDYLQDRDGHKVILTPDHLNKLRRGEALTKILTTVAAGHQHEVRIDPKKNIDPRGASLRLAKNVGVAPGQTPPTETLYAKLEDKENPSLYVTGSKPLQDGSVEFCLDERVRCESDPSLWRGMRAFDYPNKPQSLQVYAGDPDWAKIRQSTPLDKLDLLLRAKLKDNGELIKQLIQLSKK